MMQEKCSGVNQERSKLICGWILMRETTAGAVFQRGRVIRDYELVFESKNAGFVSSFVFSRCYLMFLSALFLTAPIHC